MTKKETLKLFEERKVRTVWDDEKAGWEKLRRGRDFFLLTEIVVYLGTFLNSWL